MSTIENKVIETLKTKIKLCHGSATMPVLKGNPIPFEECNDKSGFTTDRLADYVLKWEHFAAIITKANSLLGRKMYRGDTLAQATGSKLGIDIPLNTMEGFIASELLDIPQGMSITRRSTYYSGILAWANIVTIHKSEGSGSYIVVNNEFRE